MASAIGVGNGGEAGERDLHDVIGLGIVLVDLDDQVRDPSSGVDDQSLDSADFAPLLSEPRLGTRPVALASGPIHRGDAPH